MVEILILKKTGRLFWRPVLYSEKMLFSFPKVCDALFVRCKVKIVISRRGGCRTTERGKGNVFGKHHEREYSATVCGKSIFLENIEMIKHFFVNNTGILSDTEIK